MNDSGDLTLAPGHTDYTPLQARGTVFMDKLFEARWVDGAYDFFFVDDYRCALFVCVCVCVLCVFVLCVYVAVW